MDDIKLFIKTVAELTGIRKLLSFLNKTFKTVRALTWLFVRMGRLAKSSFQILRSGARLGLMGLSKLRNMAFVAAGAIAGMIRESVRFNTEMAKVNTMVKKADIKSLSRDVIKLAGDLGIAKSQLAEGLYQALSAGVPEENAISFLATAAKAGVAGATDTATAVDGLTTVLNAFKIPATEVERVADIMFTTVKNGKTTFEELSQSLAVAAPIAAANGVEFEQVAAAVATLTKQGTPTSVAMTQIRAAIIGLNRNLGDGWAKTMTLQDAFSKMVGKAKGSQVELQKMMGRVEGVNAILGLTGRNAKMAASDLDEMSRSAGNMGDAFNKMETVKRWPKLWETIRGIVAKLGDVFDRVIAPLVEKITVQLAKWRDTEKIFETLEEKLIAMREHAHNIWAALSQGKGEMENAFAALKDIFIGILEEAAKAAGRILLKISPFVGRGIGNAAAEVLSKALPWKWTRGVGERMAAKDLGISVEELRAKKLRAAGETEAAQALTEGKNIRLERGLSTFRQISKTGSDIRQAAGETAQLSKTEQAKAILGKRLEMEERELVSTQEKVAAGERKRPGYAEMPAVKTILGREEADVRRVVNALEQVSQGNEKLIQTILGFAEKTKQQNKTLESQIKKLPI